MPKFIFYIKRRNLLYINKIHFFYNLIHIVNFNLTQKNGWTHGAHPSNKRTRLKVSEGVNKLCCEIIFSLC
jgi:hypothetical protein